MYSVGMALVDFIPVFLFAVAAIILQRDLYHKMGKGVFALFAAGTIDVILAGFLKALYKLLYALGVCDFQPLTQMFFPVQAIGLLLAGIAVARTAFFKTGKQEALLSVAVVPLFSGTFIFVSFMVLGLGGMAAGLSKFAVEKKKPLAVVLFVLTFLFYMGMGYLSSKNFTENYMNWVAEGVNLLGQITLLSGTLILHKAWKEEAVQTEG